MKLRRPSSCPECRVLAHDRDHWRESALHWQQKFSDEHAAHAQTASAKDIWKAQARAKRGGKTW